MSPLAANDYVEYRDADFLGRSSSAVTRVTLPTFAG